MYIYRELEDQVVMYMMNPNYSRSIIIIIIIRKEAPFSNIYPTTIRTMGVNITTIAYIRVLIIEIGSTIILMVVEAQGIDTYIYIN